MKQKLGLACALMARPAVLLLDEPSVGVDPVSRQDLWRMVQALTDDGMAGYRDPVRVALAIRDKGTCEVLIPAARFDPFDLLDLVERHAAIH